MIAVETNRQGFLREIKRPDHAPPALACDCHMHIIGPFSRFPLRETRDLQPPEATVADYRAVMDRLGLERCVVVQPSFYATDNSCTLSAVAEIGDGARAVVVVGVDTTDEELRKLHAAGARGVRLQRIVAGGIDPGGLKDFAKRLAPLGWHIQLFATEETALEMAEQITALPVPVVFDHMAHLREEQGEDGPGFAHLLKLLESGRAWVKLSNAFFPPSSSRARRLIAANPDRMVWGSDWPHVAYRHSPPDDGHLVDLLSGWAPDAALREKIFSVNPGILYFQEGAHD